MPARPLERADDFGEAEASPSAHQLTTELPVVPGGGSRPPRWTVKKAENIHTPWLARAGIIIFLAVSSACGGGGGGGDSSPTVGTSPPPPPTPNPPPPQPDPGEEIIDNEVSGSVGDGPITSALVRIYNKQGTMINTASSDQEASFNILVREKGKYYPLTLTASGGTDVVTGGTPDFDLRSVVAKPSRKTQGNLNPHATLIIKAAENMTGGLLDNNLASARVSVMSHMNFGMDSAIVSDPITAPVTDGTAPVLVKSSETMGEMIRRTRDALIVTGYRVGSGGATIDGNAVVESLAADIIDGVIDGRGGPAADARIAGVANIASGVVLVEALINKLKVGGADATARMDDAIRLVRPNAPSGATTANVTIPGVMLSQTALVVEAAVAFSGNAELQSLLDAIRTIPAGTTPAGISNISEAGQAALENALNDAAFASDSEIEIINAAVRNTAPEPPPPEPPPEEPPPDPPPPGNGTATVSWTAPTEREDGTPLGDELAGFKIYYGQSQNQLSEIVVLNNPGLPTYVVEGLEEQSTWYFAVSAFDVDGRESARSTVASKTFP